MKNIILTAQSTGNNRLRLGIGTDDSRKIFKCRGVRVIIRIEGLNDIRCVTTCGQLVVIRVVKMVFGLVLIQTQKIRKEKRVMISMIQTLVTGC